MIFLQDKEDKFHIAELHMALDTCYHGNIYNWVPITKGLAYWKRQQLPNHIKLCGLCLVRYNKTWKGRKNE